MSSKGKRLGSLADVFKSESLDGTIRKIRLDRIRPSTLQPRQDRKKGVEELALSLKAEGLLQPIVVARDVNDEDGFKIIAGERRYHAASSLGWSEIECKIFDRNEKEIYKLAIIENLQREDLSAFEEADALNHLKKEYKYTDSELADMFSKSRSYMTEIISIVGMSAKAMKTCKELEIKNKNLLVQAAQAEKKGNFEEFLERYKSGELRTVKEAKEFNRSPGIEEVSKSSPQPSPLFPNLKNSDQNKNPGIRFIKKPDSVNIECSDPALLMEIYKFVKKEIPKKFNL
ncbi:ParB/RepB/Spo0J family partition protein [Leptospira sp. GIMC2001]|uniref:ParB/RepB/Spo0J family partition protein n=1 Tax=Leptospira sp. GIMC2001 TaxID=1513297 RepID=UPI002349206F|nr:ParB/RepB/Spo0J family partition protein [Leptospira sp. GIMC2001]WCL47675.1 ParB/RepB/Spo0J family partition protein [Leptospira sp. GIMC2001]